MEQQIQLKKILDAGIELNMSYGCSPREQAELAESEYLMAVVTDSGLVGLYHAPCVRLEEYTPALNGTSAGGYLRRDDIRAATIRGLLS